MNKKLQSIRDYVIKEIKQSDQTADWFWDEHVAVVEDL